MGVAENEARWVQSKPHVAQGPGNASPLLQHVVGIFLLLWGNGRRWVFVIVPPGLAANPCPVLPDVHRFVVVRPGALWIWKFATLLHDVTRGWIHPFSGANNPSHWGLPLPQQYVKNKKRKGSFVVWADLWTLTMQYAAAHHQYCCSSHYRTHTVSICWLFCSLFVNTVCKSTFEWQLR